MSKGKSCLMSISCNCCRCCTNSLFLHRLDTFSWFYNLWKRYSCFSGLKSSTMFRHSFSRQMMPSVSCFKLLCIQYQNCARSPKWVFFFVSSMANRYTKHLLFLSHHQAECVSCRKGPGTNDPTKQWPWTSNPCQRYTSQSSH